MTRGEKARARGVRWRKPSAPPSVAQPRGDREIRHDREIVLDEYSGILDIRIDPDLSAPRTRGVDPGGCIERIDCVGDRMDIRQPCHPAIPRSALLPFAPRV